MKDLDRDFVESIKAKLRIDRSAANYDVLILLGVVDDLNATIDELTRELAMLEERFATLQE